MCENAKEFPHLLTPKMLEYLEKKNNSERMWDAVYALVLIAGFICGAWLYAR